MSYDLTEINRKIDIFKIDAFTLSKDPSSCEFIVHVKDEYDYRFQSKDYCAVIVNVISKIAKLKGHIVKTFRVVTSLFVLTVCILATS